MKCPACNHDLTEIEVGGVLVDICKGGCGGIWFDNRELEKFDEMHELDGEKLLDIETAKTVVVDHSERRHCPRCETMIMMRHFTSIRRETEVDECPKCGGFWLDLGELREIRTSFNTDDERRASAMKYFAGMFGEELKAVRDKSQTKLDRSKKIAHALRFICPSYWIPGDQEGAPF